MARLLLAGNFDVTKVLDGDCASMDRELQAFATKAQGGDVALFFYAGHGLQIDGAKYLVATDNHRDCQEFRVWACIMGAKEIDSHVTQERASNP